MLDEPRKAQPSVADSDLRNHTPHDAIVNRYLPRGWVRPFGRRGAMAVTGPPFMPQKTRVGNDRSQGGAAIARGRRRGDGISIAGRQGSAAPANMKSCWNGRRLARRIDAIVLLQSVVTACPIGIGPHLRQSSAADQSLRAASAALYRGSRSSDRRTVRPRSRTRPSFRP